MRDLEFEVTDEVLRSEYRRTNIEAILAAMNTTELV